MTQAQIDSRKVLDDLLAAAVEAARTSGDYLARRRSEGHVAVVAAQPRDLKLDVDRHSEELILETLTRRARISALTEERGCVEVNGAPPELRWIIDPLDGSVNYASGIPLCAVSIGLWRGDEPLLGVVYDFCRDELFTGIVGLGAWLNEAPLHVNATSMVEHAVLCTGFPVGSDFSRGALAEFVDQIRRYRKVRLLGSAALSLAYVAAGRADAYYERGIKLWDVAAGVAIVQSAGGAVVRTPLQNNGLTVYAGGPSLPPPGDMGA